MLLRDTKPSTATVATSSRRSTTGISRLPTHLRTDVSKKDFRNKLRAFTKKTIGDSAPKDFLVYGRDILDFSRLPENIRSRKSTGCGRLIGKTR